MPTIDSRRIIDRLIANNGEYEGDPPVVEILEYTNDWGKQTWFVAYDPRDLQAAFDSPYVHNPRSIWKKE